MAGTTEDAFQTWIRKNAKGKISIVERKGHGMSGSVYLVDVCRLRVIVKVMFIGPRNSDESVKREIDLASGISSPYVDTILTTYAKGDIRLIFRRYEEVVPIQNPHNKDPETVYPWKSMDRREAAKSLPLSLVEGYQALRKRKIVHRDLYPDNVLVRRNGGTAIITDFGEAKRDHEVADLRAEVVRDLNGIGHCLFSFYASQLWDEDDDPPAVAASAALLPSTRRDSVMRLLLTPEVYVSAKGRVNFTKLKADLS